MTDTTMQLLSQGTDHVKVLFALTILIFALETISSPAFPEQAFAMVNFDPVSTVLAFSPFCWLGY
ncbi:hypothetical protein CL8NIID93_11640 [Escherichia coli]|nr:hypothetical protein CL8NIID93_11640 [Escherichia coli]